MAQLFPLGEQINVSFALGEDGRIFSNKFSPHSEGTHIWEFCTASDGSQDILKRAFMECVTEWQGVDDVCVTLVNGREKVRLSLDISPLRTFPRTFYVHGRIMLTDGLLTRTEKQVLALVAAMDVAQIAKKRGVTSPTVRRTIARLKAKLGVSTDAGLGAMAARFNLVD